MSFTIIPGSDAIYLRETGQADKPIIRFNYDDGTNLLLLEFLTVAGDTFLAMQEADGAPPVFTGSMIDQIADTVAAIDWQESVLDRWSPVAALPVGPSDGDRYLSTASGNGWFANHIYTWDDGASEWVDTEPNEGMSVFVADENAFYRYADANWNVWFNITDLVASSMGFAAPTDPETLGKYTQLLGSPTTVQGALEAIINELTGLGLTVVDLLNTPPGAPTLGDRYIIDDTPTDAWVGHAGELAVCTAEAAPGPVAWSFHVIRGGTMVIAGTPMRLYVNNGSGDWLNFGTLLEAADIPIADAGTLYTATDVEGALAEVKAIADEALLVSGTEVFPHVLAIQNAPPVGPVDGDTYVVGPAGSGAWAGHDNEGAYYAVDHWEFQALEDGYAVIRDDYDQLYIKDTTFVPASPKIAPVDAVYFQHDADGVQRFQTGMAEQIRNQGHIGKAVWTPADNPTADDEIGIGADTYIFKNTTNGELNDPPASPVETETWLVGSAPTGAWVGHANEIATCLTDDTPGPVTWSFLAPGAGEIFVEIGAALADTLAALVIKIHDNGTENMLASENDIALTTKTALSPGGAVTCAVHPAVSATEVGDPWVSYAPGKVVGGRRTSGRIALTTANIAAPFEIDLDFTPTGCAFQIKDATGIPQAITDALMTVGASKLTFDPGSDCADTDVLDFEAWS